MIAKPKLIVAGPGAGKTYGIVSEVFNTVPELQSNKYLVVTTYTNAATENIKHRLSKKMSIPNNVFIGTMHAFLNKFIVVPYISLVNSDVQSEKLFVQCSTDDIFKKSQKGKQKLDFKEAAIVKKRIKDSMKQKGFITFDQTIALARECFQKQRVKEIVSNRIQYLFIDEFQDTSNQIFEIVEHIRKQKKTNIYCVGDPEQFIQSYDSKVKEFKNIPILKASRGSTYNLELKEENYRSTVLIAKFLNNFNGRYYDEIQFSQKSVSLDEGENVLFINAHSAISNITPHFKKKCDQLLIEPKERCIICKKNDTVNRCIAALEGNFLTPDKSKITSPLKEIKTIFLSVLNLNQTEFCFENNCDVLGIRKHCLRIMKAIKNGEISDENTFGKFINDNLGLQIKGSIPAKIKNLINSNPAVKNEDAIQISNIHIYKGLEADGILAIAKTNEELDLWLETDVEKRETKRTNETTDYPRLGYVAFSRARKLLCIGCLEPVSQSNLRKLIELNVKIMGGKHN